MSPDEGPHRSHTTVAASAHEIAIAVLDRRIGLSIIPFRFVLHLELAMISSGCGTPGGSSTRQQRSVFEESAILRVNPYELA
jgi:hypothetical protein